jgi:hypothetical protein
MATLKEVIEQALVMYNEGSDNEEYRRGQEELAAHIFEYYEEQQTQINDGTTRSGDYHLGAQHEQERIIEYLLKMNVLREAMFYEGWVAMDVDGNKGIDLDIKLGGM